MKNFLLPLLAGLLIGSVASYVILNIQKNKECFVCISKNEFKQENLIGYSPDSLKQSLIKSFDFTSEINRDYDAKNLETRRITDAQATLLMTGACTGRDTAVLFNLDTLVFALMRAKNITKIENVGDLQNLDLVSVFAKYPSTHANTPNRHTAIIQFAERIPDGRIDDIRDSRGIVRYNFGNLCPDQCPSSLRRVQNPLDSTNQTGQE